jgi:large subunit ribosomal protein L15
MKLHSLKTTRPRTTKRVGRGGKRGTTAGRGTKGQHSRAGRRLRPAVRDLIIRLPKLRGFRNKPVKDVMTVVDLAELSAKLKSFTKEAAQELNHELMKTAGILSKNFKGQVKILSDGEIAFPIVVKGIKVSKAALEKIEKAGGKVL